MKTTKKIYQSPAIELIQLDKEISLILASDAPVGPDELRVQATQEKTPFWV